MALRSLENGKGLSLMKLAGALAILLALILGGWASVDYYANTQKQQELVQAQIHDVNMALRGGSTQNSETDRMEEDLNSGYRDDAFAGIGAAVCLIAGIALRAKG